MSGVPMVTRPAAKMQDYVNEERIIRTAPSIHKVRMPLIRRRRAQGADPNPRSRSHLSNKTPADRVWEYGEGLFRVGGPHGELLICRTCEKSVDPRRRSSIQYHLKSIAHRSQLKNNSVGDESATEPECPSLMMTVEEEDYTMNIQKPALYDLTQSPSEYSGSSSPQREQEVSEPVQEEVQRAPAAPPVIRLAPLQLAVASSLYQAQLTVPAGLPPQLHVVQQPQLLQQPESQQQQVQQEQGHDQQGEDEPETKKACCCCRRQRQTQGRTFPDELVLKVRRRGSDDRDFVLVQLPLFDLSLSRLTEVSCSELDLRPDQVSRLVKLPNTRLRTDRDVSRLLDFQELELVEYRGLTDR